MSAEGLFALYTEVSTPEQLLPTAWRAEEELCGSFRLALTASVPAALGDTIAQQLFGQKATFVVLGAAPLVRRGVVSSVSIGGSRDPELCELAIQVVPRLDLMKLRTQSRIFQNVSTTDVLERLAKEWELPCELRIANVCGKRKYITQYRETDFDFLKRIASRDGIGFMLEHAELGGGEREKPGDEKIVFYDNAQAYLPIPVGEDRARGSRLTHTRESFDSHEHHVAGFRLERRIAPELVRLGDFDFRKPRLELRASASTPAEKRSPINSSLGGEQLSVYLHGDRAELDLEGGKSEISDELALVRLEQAQREAAVGKGASRCLRLAVGRTFTLEEQSEAPSLNQAYVVTRITHQGRLPEVDRSKTDVIVAYENAFECAPATVVYRSPLPKLDLRQVTETATVVGPEGSDIHSDELGRVKVQFHWDFGANEEGACWLRVLTTWAGANWGTQFIPRVGMEVLVGFLSGDVDQPIVLGSVYNGTHPTPFALPGEAAKAGFKTRSSPGGESGSEISFDDTKGQERIVIRGERDMTQVVPNDIDVRIGRDEKISVDGASEKTVKESATLHVVGGRVDTVDEDLERTVGGSYSVAVSGNLDVRVTGNRTERIEGREQIDHFSDLQEVFREDVVERVLGHKVTIVGENDARRSATKHVEGSSHDFATGTYEISSDKEIVLRCGKSSLRLTPDGLDIVVEKVRFVSKEIVVTADDKLEIFSKKQVAVVAESFDVLAKKRAMVSGEQGKLTLAADARLDGSVVKLNCDPSPPDPLEPPPYEPLEPTQIELTDEDGKPLVNRRFVLAFSDGSEQTGILDHEGKTEVQIEESCEITFPDVDGARRS